MQRTPDKLIMLLKASNYEQGRSIHAPIYCLPSKPFIFIALNLLFLILHGRQLRFKQLNCVFVTFADLSTTRDTNCFLATNLNSNYIYTPESAEHTTLVSNQLYHYSTQSQTNVRYSPLLSKNHNSDIWIRQVVPRPVHLSI